MNPGFRFASPFWLPVVVAVVLLGWWQARRRRPAALGFSSLALLGTEVGTSAGQPSRWLRRLRATALLLVVLALARPQFEKSETREDTRGINIMLTLDFSGTMRTRDFYLDGRRLARAEGMKRISAEFVRSRPQDRIGYVVFDRTAFLGCPLTLDHDWLLDRLQHETNGSGTFIGSGMVVAADHLQRHTNETRVIVLMTDAENISGGDAPETVAEVLRPLGVRVHIIQLLSPEQPRFAWDLSELLTHVAMRTGGSFFRVRDGNDLRSVYTAIDTLEKQKLTDHRQKAWRELFPWLAVPALLLLVGERCLAQTRWRRCP